jgi:nicotinamide-nucleotide amidase
MNDDYIYLAAEQLGIALGIHRLAVAESCTGGWLCQAITDIPGSSRWFDRGFITYSNEAKQEMLGVPAAILETYGAVSAETVRAMVAGVLERSPADCAVAVSGIAGPGGATPGKPVGTVWFAWQRRGGECVTRREQFDGNRRKVRYQAVITALRGTLAQYDVL